MNLSWQYDIIFVYIAINIVILVITHPSLYLKRKNIKIYIMLFRKTWKLATSGTDGNCILFEVNIFNYNWIPTGKKTVVKDPTYSQIYVFDIFSYINGSTKLFAAGEFSNCIWGFYVKK